MNINIPSPSINFIPKKDPFPKISLTRPSNVRANAKPSPMPNPSIADDRTVFLEAKASALPSTIQLTTISGMNNPKLSYKLGSPFGPGVFVYACINKSTIVTNEAHRFLVADQLEEMHVTCHILAEPQGKNTLPAITYGITSILKDDPDARVAVISSDQLITPDESYKSAFLAAEKLAEKYLVTFGITPDSPHTGYGYIRPGAPLDGGFSVDAFVEKIKRAG